MNKKRRRNESISLLYKSQLYFRTYIIETSVEWVCLMEWNGMESSIFVENLMKLLFICLFLFLFISFIYFSPRLDELQYGHRKYEKKASGIRICYCNWQINVAYRMCTLLHTNVTQTDSELFRRKSPWHKHSICCLLYIYI